MGSYEKHRTELEIAVNDRQLKELGATLERALSTSAADAFEKSIDRTTKAVTKLVEAVDKLSKAQEDRERKSREEDARARQKEQRGHVTRTALGTALGQTIAGLGRVMPINEGFVGSGITGLAGGAGSLVGWGLSGIPGVGPALGMASSAFGNALGGVLGGAIGSGQQYYGAHVALARARAGAFGRTGLRPGDYSSRLIGGTSRFGVGPTELPALLQELAMSGQLEGSDLARMMPGVVRRQSLGGIQASAQGAFMATAGFASMGGRRFPGLEQNAMLDALGTAVEAGISRSRLSDFLQQIASGVEQMQSSGIMIDPASITPIVAGLAGMGRESGFRGAAGSRAAMSMIQGVQGAGRRESLIDMMMLQEAGFGRGRGYMESLQQLQENPGEVLANFLQRSQGFGNGSNREGVAYALMTSFESLGTRLSARQARALSQLSPEQLDRFRGSGGRDAFHQFLSSSDPNGTFGTPSAEAGHEYARARIGGDPRVQEAVTHIRRVETRLVESVLPQVLEVVDGLVTFGESLVAAYQRGGMSGVVRELQRMITPSLERLSSDANESTQNMEEQLRRGFGASNAVDVATAGTMFEGLGGVISDALRDSVVDQLSRTSMGADIAAAIVAAVRAVLDPGSLMRMMNGAGAHLALPEDNLAFG